MKEDIARIAERFVDKAVDKAMDDPLATIRTADSILSIVVYALPTLPWETPIPIPRGIYEKLKEVEGK